MSLTAAEQAAFDESEAQARAGRELPLAMTAPRGRKPPRHWLDMTPAEREAAVAELGLPRFRADQVTRQLLVRHELDPQQWSDLPKAARAALAEAFLPELLAKVRQLAADGGRTVKTLWRLHDGALIESVLMAYRSRVTVCVSSQAGCGMACPFCATGQGGLRRNLSTAEILWQVVDAARWPGGRLSNVVFMGMGEPLANYDRLLPALRAINSDLGVSARQVTVSTVGLAPQIDRLAAEGLPVTLAISLHAPDDALRDKLCPLNTRYPIASVLTAGRGYFAATGRRVSIEYALIRDVNDQAWRADALARLLRGYGPAWAHVNLIGLNPTPGSKWTASRPADQAEFVRRLEAKGVPVTVRDTRGRDIDGACGQLAARSLAPS